MPIKQKSLNKLVELLRLSFWRCYNQGLIIRLLVTPFRKNKNTPKTRIVKILTFHDWAKATTRDFSKCGCI